MDDAAHLLRIYLDDHWAAAGAGAALARRVARNNAGTDRGERLDRLADDVAEDEASLEHLRRDLGMTGGQLSPAQVKRGLALAGERLGRLTPNGRVTGYSPLSRVLEAEALVTAVSGKDALWAALATLVPTEPAVAKLDLPELRRRAAAQLELVRAFHTDAATRAFAVAVPTSS
jgi:hypothetical protein